MRHSRLANAPVLVISSMSIFWIAFSGSGLAQVAFESDVLPIFRNHCYQCHGPDKQESGYRLEQRNIAINGGDRGAPAIVPNDASASLLYRLVSGLEEGLLMPPKESGKSALSRKELETLRTWIEQGASWPDAFSGEGSQWNSHWSLQPLVRPSPPIAGSNPLDAFIQTKLAEKNLSLSPEADRRTLIRRLTFDLIGLPPKPSDIAFFENNASPHAYEELVDRLLASPQYGERWGRHWLDAARYTESQGFEYDRLRDNAWHYRDYVIKSFNEDKPYTEFMKEQIAGDVIEPVSRDGIVATSLLVCGPWDQAGNGQSNKTQRAITREDELEDMIGVVGQTFLGLTINCARCHSHKFDPIPHVDYYRIKSVFEGVKHGERSIATTEEVAARDAKQKDLQRKREQAYQKIRLIESEGEKQALALRSEGSPLPGPTPYATWNFGSDEDRLLPGELLGGATLRRLESTGSVLQLPKPGAFFQTTALTKTIREKTLEAWLTLSTLEQSGGAAISIESATGNVFDAIVFGEQKPRQWTSGSEGFARTQALDVPDEVSDPNMPIHLAIVYSADNTIAIYRNGAPLGAPYQAKNPLPTFVAGDARVLIGKRHTGGGKPWLTGEIRRASLYDRALTQEEISASFRSQGSSVSHLEIVASLSPESLAAHTAAVAEAKQAQAALEALEKLPVSYVGVRVQPPVTRRLTRGDVHSPEEEVAPGALSAIAELESHFGLLPDALEKDRRVKFADWLADDRNPLPARVMVNRVWHLHFGQGLVPTPNDFGAGGERPSHPELLDWLALQFMENRWSVKALHKWIVQSATYRQRSDFNALAASVDADNRLLWRFAPRRLEAEAIRDAMLSASGQLNSTVGGPSFRPFSTTEFNATFYTPVDRDEPNFYRRTVYRMNVNSGKDPLLDAFDCPDPSVKTPKRSMTTTPIQALGLMNNAFVQRLASKLAQRSIEDRSFGDSKSEPLDAIGKAYEWALGRRPSPEEWKRADRAVAERGLESVCWALFNSTEFIYVR